MILFCLMTQRLPFDSKFDKMILFRIEKLILDFAAEEFHNKTVESIDMVKKMLIRDLRGRMSAA